ncbi:MAG: SpoIIE family protein phosphatase [Bdellovibrionaceae bacterium]|nr:SpoIIE family protein phosphatase [Pseudobdellovibrionaceae bacterium]NUM58291.1 SpoIIE family protein phosphatase [Pseudobdellovibrionaceae bacterium]
MQKNKFSLRYKILVLLTLIPLITLSAYLILAMKIFETDKIAYVFDSSGNLTQTIATQIKTQLTSIMSSNKFIFQDFLTKNSFDPFASEYFKSESNTELLLAYEVDLDSKRYKLIQYLQKNNDIFNQNKDKIETILSQEIYYVKDNERTVYSFGSDSHFLMIEKVPPKDLKNNKSLFFVIVFQLGELQDVFQNSGAQKLFLVDKSAKIRLGSTDVINKNFKTLVDVKFIEKNRISSLNGVEIASAADKKEFIISYAQVGIGGLTVISSVLKSRALSALDILLKKSIIFFVILIAVTTIISLFASSSITNAITLLFTATQKVSEGDFTTKVQIKSSDEVGVLADNFNRMSEEILRLLKQTAEKARMENELQTAKTVQETLFPEARKKYDNIEISGFYEPASECGGDWWHYCQVGTKLFFWIGDATGHGAPSALITSAAKSAAVIIESLNVGPAKALEYLNHCIYEVSRGRLMMTFFIGCYDTITSDFTYANASHEAPYLIKNSTKSIKKKDLIPLNDVNSPRLGQSRDSLYQETTVRFENDDLIYFYTDGVPDVVDPSGQPWGEREFIKTIIECFNMKTNSDEFIKKFAKIMNEYRKGSSLVDDVTFFVVKNKVY